MIKLVCIDNAYFNGDGSRGMGYLTLGKIYNGWEKKLFTHSDVLGEKNYYVVDDDGLGRWVSKQKFITLEDHRQQQLDKIING